MSQSATLVGFIVAAFLLYVAAKGRLSVYTGVLWGAKPGAAAPTAANQATGTGGASSDLVNRAYGAAIDAGEAALLGGLN